MGPSALRTQRAGFQIFRSIGDGGALLLRAVEGKIDLLDRLAGCFRDGRIPLLVKRRLPQMPVQRIYGLALGYEDLNDHEQLRTDSLMALLSGKRGVEAPRAGKSTLNRLELVNRTRRYHMLWQRNCLMIYQVTATSTGVAACFHGVLHAKMLTKSIVLLSRKGGMPTPYS